MCERVCKYGAGVVDVYAGMVFITLLNVTWLLYIIWVISWSVLSGCCFRRFAHWQALSVDKAARAAIKNQTGRVVWLTGLSGFGGLGASSVAAASIKVLNGAAAGREVSLT